MSNPPETRRRLTGLDVLAASLAALEDTAGHELDEVMTKAHPQQVFAMLAGAGIDQRLVTNAWSCEFSVALKYGGRFVFGPAREADGGWDWTRYDRHDAIEDQGHPETWDDLISDLVFSLSLTD